MLIISKERVVIKRGYDAATLMQKILNSGHDADGKYLWSIGLNLQGETLYVGRLDEDTTTPRRLFRTALLRKATAVIFCHLSDNPKPSKEDIKFVRRLSHAGEIIGINVLDCVLFNDTRYFSFREYGMNKLLYETKTVRKFS